MFKRNRITLFCLIGSMFGVSMMIGMMKSKPVSSPSASQSSIPSYKPFHQPAPTTTPSVVTGDDIGFIAKKFTDALRLFKGKDGDGIERMFLGYKAPSENPDRASMELLLGLCDDMSLTSSNSEFHKFLNTMYITKKDYVISDIDYQKAKDICTKLLAAKKGKAK